MNALEITLKNLNQKFKITWLLNTWYFIFYVNFEVNYLPSIYQLFTLAKRRFENEAKGIANWNMKV
jgi:hypothetical protein